MGADAGEGYGQVQGMFEINSVQPCMGLSMSLGCGAAMGGGDYYLFIFLGLEMILSQWMAVLNPNNAHQSLPHGQLQFSEAPCMGHAALAPTCPKFAWAMQLHVCVSVAYCSDHGSQGTFADLDGGSSLWAFECLTGNYVFKFKLEGNAWKRYDLVHPKEKNGKIMLQPAADSLSSDDMFATLSFYVRKRSVVGASTGAGSDKENINGIVQVRGPAGAAGNLVAHVDCEQRGGHQRFRPGLQPLSNYQLMEGPEIWCTAPPGVPCMSCRDMPTPWSPSRRSMGSSW